MANVKRKGPKVAKRPEDRPIDARGCFGLCCYNIPQGTLIVLMPGLILLSIGVCLLAAWYPPDMLAILMLSLGGAMTVMSLFYWVFMWCRYRPRRLQKRPNIQVQLVAQRLERCA